MKNLIIFLISLALCSCLGLGLWLQLRRNSEEVAVFGNAAVVANGVECAQIGIDILKRNGSVADAAIATLFCEGVACPQSMGLGGGFLLTIYKKDTGKVETLNARETAPAAATEDMFAGIEQTMRIGGQYAAVPGQLQGYRELYKSYGSLPWRQLVEPTIKLCREGHIVTKYFVGKMTSIWPSILRQKLLRDIFINPATGKLKTVGDRIKRPKLADTLEIIAAEGPDALHNGTLTKQFVKDIKRFDGIITEEDMKNYKAKWEEPVKISLADNLTLYSSPLPGSGVILAYIMNILNGFVPDSSVNTITEYHRIVETFKFAFGQRARLGDREFVDDIDGRIKNLTSVSYAQATRQFILDGKTSNDSSYYGTDIGMTEDHGTAHISILAPNGDAIAVTSSLNNIFGARCITKSSGIILNNQMGDFTIPRNNTAFPRSNYIVPGKRPMSSMCPTIIIDKDGNAKLIIGAEGGLRIPTVVSFVAVRYLWYNESLMDAMKAKRVYHQLIPMRMYYDEGFNEDILDGLEKIGHEIAAQGPYGNVIAVAQENGNVYTAIDPKRIGSIAGY